MKISLVCPTRNNLKYLKWSYASVRKHQGEHKVIYCIVDDASTDGTWDWISEQMLVDPDIRAYRNDGPNRKGLVRLYNDIVKNLVDTDIAMIWHSDMYLCPGALDEIEKLLYTKCNCRCHNPELLFMHSERCGCDPNGLVPNYKSIISLTRIEPPLHPDGPEKYLANWGIEPEEFNETAFLQWFVSPEAGGYAPKYDPPYTNGVFAPWAFFVDDYKSLGGHDADLFLQSKDDSDIFNRMLLAGYNFVQTWEGCVYHFTSRGSRFSPLLTTPGKNSAEWEIQNAKSTKNFIRKWGSMVFHDQYLHPIVPHRYHIGIVINNCTLDFLGKIEPWGYKIYTAMDPDVIAQYIQNEDTTFDLAGKIHNISTAQVHDNLHDVMIYIDRNTFNNTDYQNLTHISFILAESGQSGSEMVLGNMRFKINALTPHELDLVHI